MVPSVTLPPKCRRPEIMGSCIRNLLENFGARKILRMDHVAVKWRERSWESFAIELFPRLCPCCFSQGYDAPSEEHFPAHHLDRVAAYPNVNHTVIVSGSADEDFARPFHLDALFDEHALVGLGDAVSNHPRGGTPCRRPRRRIFAVVKNHAGV